MRCATMRSTCAACAALIARAANIASAVITRRPRCLGVGGGAEPTRLQLAGALSCVERLGGRLDRTATLVERVSALPTGMMVVTARSVSMLLLHCWEGRGTFV